ncbi:IclR family transcriptional regulator [Rhodococcus sp. GXMU-t2271]|uniref:IclR family transcriptional regulator n=1 Tax=Rhodococcus sp. GXMU-t2271 TaxID=3059079 RepID=UPI00352BB8AA
MTTVDGHTRSAGRNPPSSMIERVTSILDAFGSPSARLPLEDVVHRTGIPRSTTHRILNSLAELHWVEHTSCGYRLGRRALAISGNAVHTEIRKVAAPVLHELHIQTKMVVHLSVLDGRHVLYLDKIGGRAANAVPSRVGGRLPAHATAAGKALLACIDPEQVHAECAGRMVRSTANTINSVSVLHQELHRIRQRRGIAIEREEVFPGIGCVGTAVHGSEGPVAALSLCGDARSAPLEHVAPLVLDAARAIAETLHLELGSTRRSSESCGPARTDAGARRIAGVRPRP